MSNVDWHLIGKLCRIVLFKLRSELKKQVDRVAKRNVAGVLGENFTQRVELYTNHFCASRFFCFLWTEIIIQPKQQTRDPIFKESLKEVIKEVISWFLSAGLALDRTGIYYPCLASIWHNWVVVEAHPDGWYPLKSTCSRNREVSYGKLVCW